jgi:hypothetical protein
MFLIHGSFAQLVSTTDIPSQGMFRAGLVGSSTPSTMTPSQGSFQIGTQKSTPTTQTPSQMTFAGGVKESGQISSPIQTSLNVPTQMYNISIANALKEGDALHVLVANNGTTAADLANWKLVTDNGKLTFTFPGFTLMPGTMVTIHTHKGNNTMSDLYGSNFMWNGTSEIKLLDNNGMLVYDYRIGAGPARSTIPIHYPLKEHI